MLSACISQFAANSCKLAEADYCLLQAIIDLQEACVSTCCKLV